MGNFLVEISRNGTFIIALIGWAFAQTVKVGLGVYREKRFNFKWFVGTGGMPSSHASGVSSLTTMVGLSHGFSSAIFGVTLMFSLIVMFDAQSVRWATGKQAEILNRIVDDIYSRHEFREERLKELLGHTPVEVLAGACIGVLVGVLGYSLRMG